MCSSDLVIAGSEKGKRGKIIGVQTGSSRAIVEGLKIIKRHTRKSQQNPNGAIVEREIGFNLAAMEHVHVTLRNPDFTTANRIAQAINGFLGTGAAATLDPSTVAVAVPGKYRDNLPGLLTDIEQLRVVPDQVARVVIDEQSGVIVMGENVRISTIAIAQGNLTIRIKIGRAHV